MKDHAVPGADIAERLLELAATIVRLAESLPKRALTRHMALQLVRAATSAGANYQEARHSESRADFIHKVGVAVKELAEAFYWLQLFERLHLVPAPLDQLREADELTAILIASARTARRNSP